MVWSLPAIFVGHWTRRTAVDQNATDAIVLKNLINPVAGRSLENLIIHEKHLGVVSACSAKLERLGQRLQVGV